MLPAFKNSKGFSLIELMVVVVILAILVSVGISFFSNAQKAARDAKRKSDIDAIAYAYEDTYNPVLAAYSSISSGAKFVAGTLPSAPSGFPSYSFVDGPDAPTPNPLAFKVCVVLEVSSDSYCRVNQQGAPSTVAFNPPAYATPSYGTPAYGTPAYGTPTYGYPTPAYGYPTPASPASKRVFVTSTTYDGNLGGLAGADAKCQTRANAATPAPLGGTWKAWISTTPDFTITNAKTPANQSDGDVWIQFNGPYQLLNGTTIANNWTDLTDGTLIAGINRTENNTVSTAFDAWTGTDQAGAIANSIYTCLGWISVASDRFGVIGAIGNTTSNWTNVSVKNCPNANGALYCFEQ